MLYFPGHNKTLFVGNKAHFLDNKAQLPMWFQYSMLLWWGKITVTWSPGDIMEIPICHNQIDCIQNLPNMVMNVYCAKPRWNTCELPCFVDIGYQWFIQLRWIYHRLAHVSRPCSFLKRYLFIYFIYSLFILTQFIFICNCCTYVLLLH